MNHLKVSKKRIGIGLLLFFLVLWEIPARAEEIQLIPVGQTVGVTLDMEGVTVVDTTDVEDYDGKRYTPAKDAGLRAGDVIESINGITIESAKQLEEVVNNQGNTELDILAKRKGDEKHFHAAAALSNQDGHYRLGIWIKDAASGIGTITYLNPETMEFGALGHGISENANEDALSIQGGEVWMANVVSIQKGGKGQPGELVGVFAEGKEKLGEVQSNTIVGLKGVVEESKHLNIDMNPLQIASRQDVCEGEAEILANVEENRVERFSVEIQKINKDVTSTKGMVVKVTDPKLLEKTGGIVQGMSGSPIIQNGKLVGAITHVFVDDPTRGYGIFIENMLAEAERISD